MSSAEPDARVFPLLRQVIELARENVEKRQGGPFGAMIVELNSVPRIVGIGANHVIASNDPSAHAEIAAIRDAAKKLGLTDLSGLTLITSCECCPMCLSAAIGSGIDTVYFAADQYDAANAGFSDANQYRLMASGMIERQASFDPDAEASLQLIKGHEAAVILHPGEKDRQIFFGDRPMYASDSTSLPVGNAVRQACRALRAFHLPEDTVILSRTKPHPLSLMIADWARIGRVRDPLHPDDPACDAAEKNVSKIRYLTDRWEEMPISDKQGHVHAIPAETLWQQINAKPPEQQMPRHHVTEGLKDIRRAPFEAWLRLVISQDLPRY